MDTKRLLNFLIAARKKTYAGNMGEVPSMIAGYKQYEYTEESLMYRDMYLVGKGRFVGSETIYVDLKPIWGMSYFGNFSAMTEEGADAILRKAMTANVAKARLWHNLTWTDGKFIYRCNGMGRNIEEIHGTEEVMFLNTKLYYFTYAGGLVG